MLSEIQIAFYIGLVMGALVSGLIVYRCMRKAIEAWAEATRMAEEACNNWQLLVQKYELSIHTTNEQRIGFLEKVADALKKSEGGG